jgi:hypothetical protein
LKEKKMTQPLIYIDSGKVRELEISIALQKIYYQPSGYQRTAKNLFEASKQAGFDFTLSEINEWLERQLLYLIHKARPKYIPCVSFNKIIIPMEVIQADILYMPYDKVGSITYIFCLTCIDVASRYKEAVPIGTSLDVSNIKDFSREGILTSATVANAFEKLINNSKNPFTWKKIKLVITDKGSEFKGNFEKLLKKHGIKNQKAKSKDTMGLVENFNRILTIKLFRIQDAHELLLPIPQRSRVWKKNLRTVINLLNNTITRLIGMTPAEAVKKKHVYAKASKPRYGPMGFDEVRLTYNDSVLYLLKPGELEGGKRRASDCNWSPKVYRIKESLIQKNQPVLYWLMDENGNNPERSFVREQLLLVNNNIDYPPKWILKQY